MNSGLGEFLLIAIMIAIVWVLIAWLLEYSKEPRAARPGYGTGRTSRWLSEQVSQMPDEVLNRTAKHYAHSLRRKRLQSLLEFWHRHRLDRTELADVGVLPFSKADAVEDLLEIFVATTSEKLRAQLFELAHELPQYQEGVGGRRLVLPKWPTQSTPDAPLTVADFRSVIADQSDGAMQVAQRFAKADEERRALVKQLLELMWGGQALTDEWRVATFGAHD